MRFDIAIPIWLFFGLFCIMAYLISDRFNALINKYVFRRKVIYCEGMTSAIRGDTWYSTLKSSRFGNLTAYRYSTTNIGSLRLNPNGTGYYCGDFRWEYV